jgi:hypothetical protein
VAVVQEPTVVQQAMEAVSVGLELVGMPLLVQEQQILVVVVVASGPAL